MSRRNEEICLWCNSQPADTRDHAPPESWFPAPRPSTLVTVRACEECNRDWRDDADATRTDLLTHRTADRNLAAKPVQGAAMRAIAKSQGGSEMDKVLRRPIQKIWRPNEEGELEEVFQVERTTEDTLRFHRVARRVIAALAYRKMQLRFDFSLLLTLPLADIDYAAHPRLDQLREYLHIVAHEEPRIIAPDIFEYRYWLSPDDPATSLWLLQFFRDHFVFGYTSPDVLFGEVR